MRKCIVFVALISIVAPLSCSVETRQPLKVSRIGYLAGEGTSIPPSFVQALRKLGYVEGENVFFEYRRAEDHPERSLDLATELAQLKVDIIVADGAAVSRAAKVATSAIPIVMMTTADPVADGLVASLARPGGNITGLVRANGVSIVQGITTFGELLLTNQRIVLIKEVIPLVSRVGILREVDRSPTVNWYEIPAASQKLEFQYFDVRSPNPDFEAAFEAAVKAHANALITIKTPLFKLYQKQIAELAVKNRLPVMSEGSDDAEAGSLISYGWNQADEHRRVATYADKILKGANPADLSIEYWPCMVVTATPTGSTPATFPYKCEQPTKPELVINLKTAKQIGLSVPTNVLARADRLIK